MTQELAGKVAFVAGGSSGINLGIAKRFAAAGAKVAIIRRSAEKIEAAAKGSPPSAPTSAWTPTCATTPQSRRR